MRSFLCRLLATLPMLFSIPYASDAAQVDVGIGYTPEFLFVRPASDMGTLAALQPGRLFYAGSAGRNMRYVTEIGYATGWKSSQNGLIGGRVTTMAMNTSLQYRAVLLSQFKPWIGVGIGYQTNSVTERHVTDAQGFTVSRYGDIAGRGIIATLRIGNYWNLLRMARWGFEWRTDYPVTSNLSRIDGIGLVMLYTF